LAHPKIVVIVSRRVSALVLTLALVSSNVALCQGWMRTAEERMACCSEGSACPMHKADEHGVAQAVSQAEADRCCAASETDESAPTAPTFNVSISLAPIQSIIHLVEPPLVRFDARRTPAPIPSTSVPKHVLLSVFLV
jgi:hypothetical protein